MTKAYYLPKADKERVAWFNTFNAIFAGIATILGFTAAEIAAINADYLAVKYVADMLDIFKVEMQERTRYKDLLHEGDSGINLGDMPTVPDLPAAPAPVKAGVFKRIIKTVQRIKTHPNYNEAMGRNLGIIGHEKTIDLNTIKPTISVKSITAESIILDFVKAGMEGVAVYAGTPIHTVVPEETTPSPEPDTENEMSWTEIARVNHAPFVDGRYNKSNKPETRYYKMRYFIKDALVGVESDIIRVVSTRFKAGSDLANKLK